MEGLKGVREKMRSRAMKRRLHNMPFRKIQCTCESLERGFKPEFTSAENTSKTCPICGETNEPNGHVFTRRKCGYRADRHLVAALNIANKLSMRCPSPLAARATEEVLKAEVERIYGNYSTTVKRPRCLN